MKITLLTGQTFDFAKTLNMNIKVVKSPLAKKLTLRIDEKNRIPVLTIPKFCSSRKAISFVEEHQDWIQKNLAKIPLSAKFTNGDSFSFMGKSIIINHSLSQRGAQIKDGFLFIGGSKEFLHRRVCDFIKKQAQKELFSLSCFFAQKINCKIHNITLKDTKSRWGSCSNKNNINYNWRIALAPYFVIEYLVCHEVSHLAHQNHSADFWQCVAELCPQYQEGRNWLKTNGKELYKYL